MLDLALIPTEDRQRLVDALITLYLQAPDGGTHSAAGWALRRWKIELPPLDHHARPAPPREWFVNQSGVTMLRIPDGEYHVSTPLVRGFYLADRETTVRLFQEFIQDATCPEEDKPSNWRWWRPSVTPEEIANDEKPVGTSRCSLSVAGLPDCGSERVRCHLVLQLAEPREGRTPCYTRSPQPWMIVEDRVTIATEAWLCDFEQDGYRLPPCGSGGTQRHRVPFRIPSAISKPAFRL